MLRQDGHGHVVQECVVGLGQNKCDLGVGDDLDLLDLDVVGVILGTVVGIHDGFDGELDIVSGKLLPVMPLDVAAELEGIGQSCVIVSPAFSQAGNRITVLVQLHQGVEQQMLDLTVLVHNGVDGIIVAGAVDQCGTLVAAAGAAGCETQNHDGSQQKHNKFLHYSFPFYYVMGRFQFRILAEMPERLS